MFFLNHKMKKLFILLVIGIISSLQTLSWSVEPDKDLVLYLPMEKDLLDASGNKNDGELANGKVSLQKGKFGKAIELAPDQPIVIEPSDSLHGDIFLEPFTYTLWINPDFKGTEWGHLWRSLPGASGHNTLFLNSAQGLFSFRGVVGGWSVLCQTDGGLVKKNTWYQVTLTSDTKKFRIYLNGKLEKEDDYQDTKGKIAEFRIGGSANETYSGLMDDVAFYKRALDKDEIKSITNSGMDAFLSVASKGKLTLNWATIKTE